MTNVLDAIGGTPLVELRQLPPEGCAQVFVKLEYYNPTGSYKDRMAKAMIEGAERRGELRPKSTVVEYTGGSTGSSLALVCAVKGYRLKLVSSDAFAKEKLDTMRALGAEVILVPSDGGRITPDLIPRARAEAKRIHEEEGAFWTDQFNNSDAVEGYTGIGREIFAQLDGAPDAFVGAVGTAGMIVGVSTALKKKGTRIVALEPASSPILTQGRSGTHRVEGVGAGFEPPLLHRDFYDETIAIDEADARDMARRLARQEGIFAGTSTGMNVLGALVLASRLGPGKRVVTVAVDTGLKYLAGDLYR
ncbi:MAG TPA: cysteine synthase family protein [Vicinamibacteria bacterium]